MFATTVRNVHQINLLILELAIKALIPKLLQSLVQLLQVGEDVSECLWRSLESQGWEVCDAC